MKWSPSKSLALAPWPPLLLNNSALDERDEVTLLSVSLNRHGITSTRLTKLQQAATTSLSRIIRILRKFQTSYSQRLSLMKTFILSIVYYVLWLHPLFYEVLHLASVLERRAAELISGTRIPQRQTYRALSLARLQSHLTLQLVRSVSKLYYAKSRKISDKASQNFEVVSTKSTVRPLLSRFPLPSNSESITDWVAERTGSILRESWVGANADIRQIPTSNHRQIPPVLRSALSLSAHHTAVLWYFSNLPVRTDSLMTL